MELTEIHSFEKKFTLGPLQEGLVFDALYSNHPGTHIQQVVLRFDTPVDADLLKASWDEALSIYEVLRTEIAFQDDGVGWQRVRSGLSLPFREVVHEASEGFEEHLQRVLAEDRARGIDLQEAPLFRLCLLRDASPDGEGASALVWSVHHVVIESYSARVLIQETTTCYDRLQEGSIDDPAAYDWPQATSLQPYVAWCQSQDEDEARAFWQDYLAGITASTPLNLHPDRTVTSADPVEVRTRLSAETSEALRAFSRNHRLPLATLVQGAWALVLSRYGDANDVTFGTTRSGRSSVPAAVADTVGMVMNTTPLRVRVDAEAPLIEWLRSVRAQYAAVRPHEHTSLGRVREWSTLPSDQPLLPTVLNFDQASTNTVLQRRGGAWTNRTYRLVEQSRVPLTTSVYADDRFLVKVGAAPGQFDEATVRRVAGHVKTALQGLASATDATCVGDIGIRTASEIARVDAVNRTARPYSARPLPAQIEAQVRACPEATALVRPPVDLDGDQAAASGFADVPQSDRELRVDYATLWAWAGQWAERLRDAGVRPGARVGVSLDRELCRMAALLGVWRAGAAYVPFDPDYPSERLHFMAADAELSAIVTRSADWRETKYPVVTPSVPRLHGPAELNLDLNRDLNPARRGLDAATPGDLAYIIYTSGSTGCPKGVEVEHGSISNRIQWMQLAFALSRDEAVLHKTPFSFDVSVWELFWPLIAGARQVIALPGSHRQVRHLAREVARSEVQVMHFVPSMLEAFVSMARPEEVKTLRAVICSGETLTRSLTQRFADAFPDIELYNLYGPTEAAIDVTWWNCTVTGRSPSPSNLAPSTQAPVDDPPIGKPVANTRAYVLDKSGREVPMGVQGELWIGGVQVARGYRNRPSKTEAAFRPDPWHVSPGATVALRTSDALPNAASEMSSSGPLSGTAEDPILLDIHENNVYVDAASAEGAESNEAASPSLDASRVTYSGTGQLYRTGDLARWRSDGALLFMGRMDNQVQLRGHRIELGEVETALRRQDGIVQASAAVVEVGEGSQLIAHVVLADGLAGSPADSAENKADTAGGILKLGGSETVEGKEAPAWIRPALASALPEYMVPNRVIAVDHFPLSANGKVDADRLPGPRQLGAEAEPTSTAEQTPTERRLCSLWSDILGRPDVGPTDNFFVLGGHSLTAVRAAFRAESVFRVVLDVRSVFEAPTVSEFAATIDALRSNEEGRGSGLVTQTTPLLQPVNRDDYRIEADAAARQV